MIKKIYDFIKDGLVNEKKQKTKQKKEVKKWKKKKQSKKLMVTE